MMTERQSLILLTFRASSAWRPATAAVGACLTSQGAVEEEVPMQLDERVPLSLTLQPAGATTLLAQHFSSCGWPTNVFLQPPLPPSPLTTSESSGDSHHMPHATAAAAAHGFGYNQLTDKSFGVALGLFSLSVRPFPWHCLPLRGSAVENMQFLHIHSHNT